MDIPSSSYRKQNTVVQLVSTECYEGSSVENSLGGSKETTIDTLQQKQQDRSKRIYRPMSHCSPSPSYSKSINRDNTFISSPRISATTPRNKRQVENQRRATNRETNATNSRSRLEDSRKHEMFHKQMEDESKQWELDVGILIEEEAQAKQELEQFEIGQYELEMMLNDLTISDVT